MPLVSVHDADPAKNGQPLSVLRAACPEEHRAAIFGGEIVWHRVSEFQEMALTQIAERLLLASVYYSEKSALPLSVQGGLAWTQPAFDRLVALYVSPRNPAGDPVAAVLQEQLTGLTVVNALPAAHADARNRASRRMLTRATTVGGAQALAAMRRPAAKEPDAVFWLLFLHPEVWEEDRGVRLAAEVEAAVSAGVRLIMLYDPESCSFASIIDATPLPLKTLRIYDRLAIEWRGGALRDVSVRLVARALGARMEQGCSGWMREVAGACQAMWSQGGGGDRELLKSRSGRVIEMLEGGGTQMEEVGEVGQGGGGGGGGSSRRVNGASWRGSDRSAGSERSIDDRVA